jgi:hypothetical protein
MNFSSRTPDFPIEFNQQNSIPPSPTLPVRSRYRVGRSVESEGCTRKGAPAVHLQSLVNLLASTIRSYSHAFSRCPCRLRTGTTRMLVLSTATVVLHELGKNWGNPDPVGTRAGVPFERIQSRLCFTWVGTSETGTTSCSQAPRPRL